MPLPLPKPPLPPRPVGQGPKQAPTASDAPFRDKQGNLHTVPQGPTPYTDKQGREHTVPQTPATPARPTPPSSGLLPQSPAQHAATPVPNRANQPRGQFQPDHGLAPITWNK